jgi:hypothetical protein
MPGREAPYFRIVTSGSRIRKIAGTLLKGWRALAFLLIALIALHYAFHYNDLSDPGSESKQLANHSPLEISFLVSNPKTSIDVKVTAAPPAPMVNLDPSVPSPDPRVPGSADVSITVYPPPNVRNITFLMLANTSRPDLMDGERFNRLESLPTTWGDSAPTNGSFIMADSIKVRSSKPEKLEVLFDTTNDLEQTNAYLYGHLPAIGATDQSLDQSLNQNGSLGSTWPAPAVLAETYKNAPYRIRDMSFHPGNPDMSVDLNPNAYSTPYGGPAELFWTPAKLSITETQSGLASAVENQQVTHITPGGQPNGPDYTWQGSGYLEPTFQTTDSDALKSESDSAFRSGILFGVVGAAAIAFVQEIPKEIPKDVREILKKFSLPEWWLRRKGKRKASLQNAVDAEPDPTVDEKAEVDAKPNGSASRSLTGLGWPSSQSNVLRRAARYRSSHQIANARSAMRAPQPRKDRD